MDAASSGEQIERRGVQGQEGGKVNPTVHCFSVKWTGDFDRGSNGPVSMAAGYSSFHNSVTITFI